MLGTQDLDRATKRQGGAGGIGAGTGLAPVGTGKEVHALRSRAKPAVALDVQELARGVADGDEEPGLGGVLDQEPADHGHHGGQRMTRPDLSQCLLVDSDLCERTFGVEPRRDAALP